MIEILLNGIPTRVEKGITILEAARRMGIEIPTLCTLEGLSPYGACRLCMVEVKAGAGTKLVAACTHPVLPGLVVLTDSPRVTSARRMVLELLLASCPRSFQIRALAAEYGVGKPRFRQEDEDCILCGLCVRMCREQMMAGAIGFRGRGVDRSVGAPFDLRSDVCRFCGGCMYVCPACSVEPVPWAKV